MRTYDEIVTEIGRLRDQSQAIVERVHAAGQGDEWRSEDKDAFDKIHKDMAVLREAKRRLDQQREVDAELGKIEARKSEPNEIRTPGSDPLKAKQATHEECDGALRAWMLSQHGSQDIKPEWRAAAQRLGVNLAPGSEFPFKMAQMAPRSVRSDDMASWEKRALTVTTTAGGYLISAEMNRALEEARLFFGPMLQVADIIRTDTGATLPFPTVNGTATKGRLLAINTQITLTDPAFSQMLLGAYKYSSDGVLVPEELIQDSGINISDYLGRALGERIGRILNEHFTTGGGTTLPWGIVTRASAVNLGTGTAAGFGLSTDGTAWRNILKIYHGLDPAYRMNASWMCNDAVVQTLAGLVDSTGRPLWVPSLIAGEPDRILGRPVYINNEMASAFANNSKNLLFGDLKAYKVREVRGVSILSSKERYIDYHQTLFLAFGRFDGDLLNAGTGPVKIGNHQT